MKRHANATDEQLHAFVAATMIGTLRDTSIPYAYDGNTHQSGIHASLAICNTTLAYKEKKEYILQRRPVVLFFRPASGPLLEYPTAIPVPPWYNN